MQNKSEDQDLSDKEKVWSKLTTWYEGNSKFSFGDDGLLMFKDVYGDGAEVDIFDVSEPYNKNTASYALTARHSN